MAATEIKYRPLISKLQVETLLDLCNEAKKQTAEIASCRKLLSILLHKAEIGAITPAYIATPKDSLEDSLGLGSPQLTPVQKREAAFKKWELNPRNCTNEELELVMTYRMDKGLLSEEETKQYMEAAMNEAMKKAGL